MEAPEIVILSEVWKAQAGVGGTEMEQELAAGIWKVFHLGLRGSASEKLPVVSQVLGVSPYFCCRQQLAPNQGSLAFSVTVHLSTVGRGWLTATWPSILVLVSPRGRLGKVPPCVGGEACGRPL